MIANILRTTVDERTQHPFTVSGPWGGRRRRLSLGSLPVLKQSEGTRGEFVLRRSLNQVQDLASLRAP
jgi:hypothetical protein